MKKFAKTSLAAMCVALALAACTGSKKSAPAQVYDAFHPGQEWLDTEGKPIQAHSGKIEYDPKTETYYWYGEDKQFTEEGTNFWTYGVRYYSSKDLYNWEDCGHLILPDTTDVLSPIHYTQLCDRPHLLYNPHNGKWVCWIKNLSDETQFFTVMQADDFFGPYEIVVPGFRPNGYEAGDFDLYYDEESDKAYVWFERPHWELMTMQLNDDFTGVVPDSIAHNFVGLVPPLTREAPAHFVRGGKHYLLTSGTTAYYPNASEAATFTDYLGKYTLLGNPHPADSTLTSYYSQITDVFKVPGKKDLYIALADRWRPHAVGTDIPRQKFEWFTEHFADHQPNPVTDQPVEIVDHSGLIRDFDQATINARYVWLPIRFEGDMPIIDWHDSWRIEDYE